MSDCFIMLIIAPQEPEPDTLPPDYMKLPKPGDVLVETP